MLNLLPSPGLPNNLAAPHGFGALNESVFNLRQVLPFSANFFANIIKSIDIAMRELPALSEIHSTIHHLSVIGNIEKFLISIFLNGSKKT